MYHCAMAGPIALEVPNNTGKDDSRVREEPRCHRLQGLSLFFWTPGADFLYPRKWYSSVGSVVPVVNDRPSWIGPFGGGCVEEKS